MKIIKIIYFENSYKYREQCEVRFENPKSVWLIGISDTKKDIWKFTVTPTGLSVSGEDINGPLYLSRGSANYLGMEGKHMDGGKVRYENT